ncbi:hypothetical protein LAD12857_17680 [Lacrimispora amygdalina]|uniref:Uncharacterized protein n=1 Tax=Lacrimispora amygdalina TaxID=253257 RepID=A0ABQ5M4M2_9FIRM
MKEKLYTIPLTEAFRAEDECPFCDIERQLEQDALNFTLGSSSSYMESDIREQTDEMGFCKEHFKKMYKYGNSLGNALILQTHFISFLKYGYTFYSHWLQLVQPITYFGYKKYSQKDKSLNILFYQ